MDILLYFSNIFKNTITILNILSIKVKYFSSIIIFFVDAYDSIGYSAIDATSDTKELASASEQLTGIS